MFASLGITKFPAVGSKAEMPKGKRSGRPKGAVAKSKPGKRQKHGVTAAEFVLGLLDGKSLSSADVNGAWKGSGRPGAANNTLTALVKAGKLKRSMVDGARGGVYRKA